MNHMKEIAKLLDVELDEIFLIDDYKYKLSLSGLEWYSSFDNSWHMDNTKFPYILTGEITIKKVPWKLKYKDKYFYPTLDEAHTKYVKKTYEYDRLDHELIEKKLICKTAEEAMELHDWIIDQVKKYKKD